ncbi:duf1680 domain containing protein [Phlyctema vagabunda]|uniref:Duf1680 domain containing protein n=1 Tax=Phlyctema vagabunda TaxID=108571 RepID=A0ABR4P925_9HELO
MLFSRSLIVLNLVIHVSKATAGTMSTAASVTALAPYTYDILPIGDVKPEGWMLDQLQLQGSGLSGNLFTFYRYVQNSLWLGGTEEYSELHEAAPYWYNAIVPLAYVLDDERLKDQANYFLDYQLKTQAGDGWLGPETTKAERGIWARCLLLQGMMNHAIADPQQTQKIVSSMHKFVVIAYNMLENNYTGFIQQPGDNFDPFLFGAARAHELSTTLQWLYTEHPNGQEELIWKTMNLMWSGAKVVGREWDEFFVDGVFPKKGTPEIGKVINFMHGVNMAQVCVGLRYMSQKWRMNKDESLVQQSRDAVDMVVKYQGSSSGSIIADEYVGGLSPQRGTELCMTVEMIFSLSYLYRLHGDNSFADKVELAAFNALPAAISPDFWSHQYVTQTNQAWSRNLTSKKGETFYNVVPYGNVFGLEPNFPCCTVNHGQALPKLLMTSFVSKGSKGLVHMILMPASVSTSIEGQKVSINCDTIYPFGDTLKYDIQSSTDFDFYIRVPDWATYASTIQTNGNDSKPLRTFNSTSSSLSKVHVTKGKTEVVVKLSSDIRTVQRANNTVAVYHGALLYALDISYTVSEHPALNWSSSLPIEGHNHPQALDHELLPTSNWSVAIDPSQLRFSSSIDDTELPNPIFVRGAPPVEIYAAATAIEWGTTKDSAALPPAQPVLIGAPFWAKLIPYGSAKLHMGELPALALPKLDVQ